MPEAGNDSDADGRRMFLAALVGTLGVAALPGLAEGAKLDPAETQITLPDAIRWRNWDNLPAHAGEMATLFGDLDAPGPYVVLMRWYPGFMSAPHSYRTERLSYVVSGTWWVDSGATFDPADTVPAPAGSFVRRVARTPHFDGVKAGQAQPATIALFGIGPVDMRLVDPTRPPYRTLS